MQGISPNDYVLRGHSALHDAASRGRRAVCKLLLSKGALANDRLPAEGFPGVYVTASEIAKESGFPDLASMIEEAASHPMNDITHPMNDTVHQDDSEAHEPNHVDEIQSTYTASATHTHDESTNRPITATPLHPHIQQMAQANQCIPSDDENDWFDDLLSFPSLAPDFGATVPVQNFDDQQ